MEIDKVFDVDILVVVQKLIFGFGVVSEEESGVGTVDVVIETGFEHGRIKVEIGNGWEFGDCLVIELSDCDEYF